MTPKSEAGSLSHPEPVAQEAVAIPSETEPVAWRYRVDGETDAPWAYTHKAFKNDAYILEPLYTRPSPSQGDDLVQRLLEIYEHDWRISFLAHTSDTACEAAAALSTLRARVAELEASATPQAGASEAEPLAWKGLGEDNVPEVTDRQDIASQWESDGIEVTPLYATPPDSDVVRAENERLKAENVSLRDHASLLNDMLIEASQAGSSSNGQ